ncbi:unnamed protein product [Penicillium bialowiezense]
MDNSSIPKAVSVFPGLELSDIPIIYLAVMLVVPAVAMRLARALLSKSNPLPPGPRPLPLIGNLHQHPSQPWGRYKEWHQTYGPIISFKLGQRTIIMLGSQKVVKDFSKKGYLYSSRPRMIVLGEYMFGGMVGGLMPINSHWKALHKLTVSVLSRQIIKTNNHVQDLQSALMVSELLKTQSHSSCFRAFASNTVKTLAYGQQTEPERPEADDSALVENLLFEIILEVWSLRARSALQHPDSRNWTQIIYENKPENITWEQFVYIIFELETAGTITTPLSLNILTLAAIQNPASVKKIQAELDAVVGCSRMPGFDDRSQLPYLNAFILETSRYHTFAPLGLPHAALEEGEYMGYRIPTDALIFSNQQLLNMDESTYFDPRIFRPERWIDDPELPPPSVFGFGRRSCPGANFANDSVYIAVARLLWAFHITQVESDQGTSRVNTMIFMPSVEGIAFKIRSASHQAVLEKPLGEA